MAEITYNYCFTFAKGRERRFNIEIAPDTLLLIPHSLEGADWTRLSYQQCRCCPLTPDTVPYCSIAVNLSELVISFTDTISYETCHVTCTTAERAIFKETTVQEGLSSVMGIIMATSGCPIMKILKPMARFHLPFATAEEAMFRSVSAYLLCQYFNYLESGKSDFYLENVTSQYKEIEMVNSGMLKRIKHASQEDADRNAIITLNCLAQLLNMEIKNNLQSLRPFFLDQA